MAARSTLTQLEEVQTAIQNVLAGKSWTLDGITYTYESLSALEAREKTLLRRMSTKSVRKRTRPDFS